MKRSVSYLALLGLLFIGLKLGNAIAWSWWWVLLPIYGPAALFVLCLAIIGFYVIKTNKIPGGWRT